MKDEKSWKEWLHDHDHNINIKPVAWIYLAWRQNPKTKKLIVLQPGYFPFLVHAPDSCSYHLAGDCLAFLILFNHKCIKKKCTCIRWTDGKYLGRSSYSSDLLPHFSTVEIRSYQFAHVWHSSAHQNNLCMDLKWVKY